MLHEQIRLSSPNLKGNHPPGRKMAAGLVEENADDVHPVRPAIERGNRVGLDLAGERLDLACRDVGEIRGNERILPGHRGKKIALDEPDPVRKAEPDGVFRGQREGAGGDIDGVHIGLRPLERQGKGDDPAASPHVQDAGRFIRQRGDQFHQVLGLVPRHQGALVAEEAAAVELNGAQQMLERLSRGAPFHQFPHRVQLPVAQGPVKFQVQIDPFLAQHVGQEVLRIQARALDSMLLQVACGGCDDFLNSFHKVECARVKPRNGPEQAKRVEGVAVMIS